MSLRSTGILGVLLLSLAGPASAFHFIFDCPENRYLRVEPGQAHQFSSPIQAVPPGNDRVEVTFQPHLPNGWFTQWGLRSSNETFISDAQVDLAVGLQDRLDIDVVTEYGVPGYGWIDVTIRSTEDPYDVAHCTYTLYAGVPIPPVNWDIDCTNSTLYLQDPYSYFEIHNPLVNRLPVPDTLLVQMVCDLPDQWGMHFHHGGLCYSEHAELQIPPLSAPDSMIIMGGISDVPGVGAGDMILQSKRNPSLARYCHYRVNFNSPEAAPDPTTVVNSAAVRVAPNPSAGETAFFFRQSAQTSGTLSIFGADGRLVRSFPRIVLAEGTGTVRWDGRDQRGVTVPPGIYFYRFGAGSAASRGTIVRSQ
jgi:hypothetical protein